MGRAYEGDLPGKLSEIFLQSGLDGPNIVDRTIGFSLAVHHKGAGGTL
jgi:hypothetical protein